MEEQQQVVLRAVRLPAGNTGGKMFLINVHEVFPYDHTCLQSLHLGFAVQLREGREYVLFVAKSAFLTWVFSGALDRNLLIQGKSIGQPQQSLQDPCTQYPQQPGLAWKEKHTEASIISGVTCSLVPGFAFCLCYIPLHKGGRDKKPKPGGQV